MFGSAWIIVFFTMIRYSQHHMKIWIKVGTGTAHIDYDLEPYVNISFRKHLCNGLRYFEDKEVNYKELPKDDSIENIDELENKYSKKVIKYALEELNKEGIQSAQGLYHNLNTLESRPGKIDCRL